MSERLVGEEMQSMGEASDDARPTGERRRRREAERAAALAQQQAGAERPLTRRELRYRQAEEAARLEAIATGELRLDLAGASPREPSAARPPHASANGASSARPQMADDGDPSARPEKADDGAPSPRPETADDGASSPQTSAVSAPTTERPVGAVVPGQRTTPTRRSMRERLQEPPAPVPETAAERTGRRSVVRTPSFAQGVRSLDATGQLTGIQPVVRPDQPVVRPDHPFGPAATGVGRTGPAPTGTAPSDEGEQAPAPRRPLAHPDVPAAPAPAGHGTGRSAAPAAAGPDPVAATASPAEDEDGDGYFPMRPQWVAISSISGASADSGALPTRRSLRTPETGSGPTARPAPAPEPEPETPLPGTNRVATVIKVLVLVVVAAVLGALIWLLADEAFGEDAAAAPSSPTIVVPHHPEETSAR